MNEYYYIDKEKQSLFWDQDYWPDFYRELMISDELRTMVSFDYVARHSLEQLKEVLPKKPLLFKRWRFLFLEKPSRYVRKKLIEEFRI